MPLRQNLVDAKATNMMIASGFKLASYVADATANMAVQTTWPPVLVLDPAGAAKDVLLPAEADSEGLVFFIVNAADAAENLVVKDDSDTTTIVTVAQNAQAIVHCDGVTWRQIG